MFLSERSIRRQQRVPTAWAASHWQQARSIRALGAPLAAEPAVELMHALPFSFSSEIFLCPPTASEKKSLAGRSSITHHSKVTSWSGSLSSAMRLMPGRQVKDPECRAEVSLGALSREMSRMSEPRCGVSTVPSDTSNQVHDL